jgi:crossover junction endonuclease MUS81
MEILIDYRENTLFDIINNKNINNININKQNLEIADIQICINDEYKLLFERKTMNDLLSSIKDGRYKEQKIRLINTAEPHKCCYIIESNYLSEHDKLIVESAIIHTMFRDKIHVICVNSINETAEWILKVATKCLKNPQKFLENPDPQNNYINCLKVKTKKSENIDKNTCYILQLCQIPGVSKSIALEISKIYPSLKEFYNSEITIEKLRNISLIGSKKAKIIYEYMIT